ncbi:Ger(x)C family spore germination protein [Brevibacillus sp. SYP-B805]|nr:Ger(x)C family spore germination protein [Brevibacillus sp. SYP-B805]NGQ94504.1 Ger(x)C family spore germination protein [Brevibacillus sp. SYP-B805]
MNFPGLQKMSRMLLLLFLCTSVLPIAGCWDRKEINDVLLVSAVGIDKKNDKIEISIQIVVPKATGGGQQSISGGGGGGGGGVNPTFVNSATGITIADAIAKLQEQISRKIFWGQMKVLIFGEELAKEGIREHVDYLARHPQSRLRLHVFVSKGKAADILEVLPPLEKSSAESARELALSQFGLNKTMKELLQMLKGEAGAAALPRIEEVPPTTGGEKDHTTVRLNGTAVFKKDKMVGYVNDELTRGILWLRNEIKRATVTIEPSETKGRVSLELIRAKTELIPQIEHGTWKMTLKAVAEDDVVQNATNLDMLNPSVLKMLQKEAKKDLENRVYLALKKVQKGMKADIFGFAEAFHRKYPKQWAAAKDRWDQIFPNVEVKVDATVYIHRPGVSTESPALPKNEVQQ